MKKMQHLENLTATLFAPEFRKVLPPAYVNKAVESGGITNFVKKLI